MPSLPQALPNVKAIIIGWADMLVDPADIFGLKPGEAVVMRNIGGRITPGLFEELALLGRIGEVAGKIPGGGGEFHVIVLQHNDCGLASWATPPCWRTIFRYRKRNSRQKRSPIPELRLPPMLPRSGRFRRCRVSGLYQVSSMTWQLDLLRSSCRQFGSAPPMHRYQYIIQAILRGPTAPRCLVVLLSDPRHCSGPISQDNWMQAIQESAGLNSD
jgi:hypothetical protein